MTFTNRIRIMAAALLVPLSTATVSFAQQTSGSELPGIVRITDRMPQTNGVTQSGFHHHARGTCPTGNCPADAGYGSGAMMGDCPYGCPTGNCRHCPFGHCNGYTCKHSPDYGYSPPAKYPLLRRGVQYSEFYPANWYGAGPQPVSNAPMVYQPTDTTQLGYYYQHVPFWQPAPWRLPARPVPAQWNITLPPVTAYGRGARWGHHGYYGGYYGNYQYGNYQGNGSCPVDGTMQQTSPKAADGVVVPPVKSPAPVEIDPVTQDAEPYELPPTPTPVGPGRNIRSPQSDSASSGHIRRIDY